MIWNLSFVEQKFLQPNCKFFIIWKMIGQPSWEMNNIGVCCKVQDQWDCHIKYTVDKNLKFTYDHLKYTDDHLKYTNDNLKYTDDHLEYTDDKLISLKAWGLRGDEVVKVQTVVWWPLNEWGIERWSGISYSSYHP